jgi:hypothetical protein
MFGILTQFGSLAEASHISFCGQAHLEHTFFPSRVSLDRARLVKVLGFFSPVIAAAAALASRLALASQSKSCVLSSW